MNIAADRGDFYFSWQNEPEARSYTLLISENQDLKTPLITGTVPNNFYVYRAGEKVLKPGLYYWGIFQSDAEGNASALSSVRSFTALEGELIQRTIFPPDGYIIGSTALPELQFAWRTNLPQQTRLQISDRADFSRLTIDVAVSGGTFRGRELPEGTWYWRIQTQGTGNSFETPPKTFIVVPPLPAPVLEQPDLAMPVLLQGERPVIFSWQAPPGAEYYQLKLYHGADRSRPLYEDGLIEETTRLIPMDRYPEGRYYWTVQAFTRENPRSTRRIGHVGEGSFTVQKPPRTIIADTFRENLALEEPRTPIPDTSREISFLEEPRTPIPDTSREISSLEEVRTPIPDTFRESLALEEAQTPTPDSIGAPVRVSSIPPLPEAANRLPRDGTLISGEELKQNRKLTFSWDAVPGAAGYLFTLTAADKNQEILRVGPQKATVFILEDLTLLDAGRFIWRVEAIVEEGAENTGETIQYGRSGENQFTLEFTPPPPPVLLKPGVLYGGN
jgi:hypothetical protein